MFVASLCVLGVEVAEVRVLSYSVDPLLVFCAISVALLGLGGGAIAVSARPRWLGGHPDSVAAGSLAAFAASAIVAHALFARTSERIGFGGASGVLLAALPIFALLAVPYFFAGVFIATAMSAHAARAGRLYAVNLVGSALGGALVPALVRPLGVEALLAGFSALAAVAALIVAPRTLRAPAAVIALAAVAAVPLGERLFPFQPDPGDLYGVARTALAKLHPGAAAAPRRELGRWDPMARIEVYAFPGELGHIDGVAPVRFFAQDGGAGSMIADLRGRPEVARRLFEATVYGAAYALRPAPARALVIGVGGAPDIQAALHHGTGHVTGVEINATTIAVVAGPYAAALGDPYHDPRVTVVHDDGRSFVERTRERYDVIQMTGADTYAAGAAGAFMFTESYLYTVEAFQRYWRALGDDGVLGVIRFGLEPYRVLATAVRALREVGVAHPERHLVVVAQGIWVNVLVSRRELGPADAQRIEAWCLRAGRERVHIPIYDALGFGLAQPITPLVVPGRALGNPYGILTAAAAVGREDEVIATMPMDFTPVGDDRPFFFQFLGARQLGTLWAARADDYYARGLRAHLEFLLATLVASALLLLAPVALRRAERPNGARPLTFFAAIGLGYLFVEITLMQKGALFLGHPTYSISAVLVTLLCASGLGSRFTGSAWAARLDAARAARFGALASAVAIALALLGLEALIAVGLRWPLPVRALGLVAVVAPLGFAMGTPFPSALRALGAADGSGGVAWALALNSLASVVASLVSVPLAMFLGFRAVLAVAAALYVVAALSLRPAA
jgi:spermidine synthase